MQKENQLTIEKLSEEYESECRIASARQIRVLLRNISENGSKAALYYNNAEGMIMTSLLEVSDEGFWVEQGVDVQKNRHIAGNRVTLVSSVDKVKIQFSVDGVRAVTYQGCPTFYLPLPAHLYRLQRRGSYRIAVPSSEQLRCVVPGQARNWVELPIIDISAGGMRLSWEGENIEFVQGQTYASCQIKLPEVGKIVVTLLVKNVISTSQKQGQTMRCVGCEFKDIDNATSVLLQRYVTRVQLLKADVDT